MKLKFELEEARTHKGKLRLMLDDRLSANVIEASFGTISDVLFGSSDRIQSLDDKLEQAQIRIASQTATTNEGAEEHKAAAQAADLCRASCDGECSQGCRGA